MTAVADEGEAAAKSMQLLVDAVQALAATESSPKPFFRLS
jgi:hypothetical protein